jgi:hypothetical protein
MLTSAPTIFLSYNAATIFAGALRSIAQVLIMVV